jgi:hypothetical protein
MGIRKTLLLGCMAATLGVAAPAALADPWKDESGHGRRGWNHERRGDDRHWREHRRDDNGRRRHWSEQRWEHDRREYDPRWDHERRGDYRRGSQDVLGEVLNLLR